MTPEEGTLPAVILQGEGTRVVHMRWKNMRDEINLNHVIAPGGIIQGSAIFILHTSSRARVKRIRKVSLIVTDYSGNKSSHDILLKNKWKESMDLQLGLIDRPFIMQNDNVTFLDQ